MTVGDYITVELTKPQMTVSVIVEENDICFRLITSIGSLIWVYKVGFIESTVEAWNESANDYAKKRLANYAK